MSDEIKSVLTDFLGYLGERNFSSRTLEIRSYGLKKLIVFLEKKYLCFKVSELNKNQILDFLSTFRRMKVRRNKSQNPKQLSDATLESITVSVREFLKYLEDKKYINEDFSSFIPKLKTVKYKIPNVPSPEAIRDFLNALDEQHPVDYRDKLIIEIIYNAGLRLGEVLCLKLGDVDLKAGQFFIRQGKGAKDRLVPINRHLKKKLSIYLNHKRPYFIGEDKSEREYLILGQRGKRVQLGSMTRRIADLGKKSGAPFRVYSHLFRHAFSVHLLKNGCDIKYIQVLLGHESMKVTQVYTQINDEEIRDKLLRFHFYHNDPKAFKV